jgi:uncharacterized protein
VTLLYNLLMAAVDLTVLPLLVRKKNIRAWRVLMASAGLAAIMLAFALGERDYSYSYRFGTLRLMAYGLFLHGTLLLGISAALFWNVWRIFSICCILAALGIVAAAYDAFLVEPTWLEVTRVHIASDKIDRPIKIVLLADLQTDHIGPYEQEVFRKVAAEKADLVLLAGDYLQYEWEQREQLRAQLKALLKELVETGLAPAGRLFAIAGNIEWHDWTEMFEGLDGDRATAVQSTRSFDIGSVSLTCLGRDDSFNSSLTIPPGKEGCFHIVLGHSPNFALGRIDADLLLAGHTHGGQVRLPWLGPLIVNADIPRKWTLGLAELPGGGKLLVSRGIGMERGAAPRLRFCCRPELVVIELEPAK